MPRKRHVSRNQMFPEDWIPLFVMPRKRHVSRNGVKLWDRDKLFVMPRKRHVSRNYINDLVGLRITCHASQEACE